MKEKYDGSKHLSKWERIIKMETEQRRKEKQENEYQNKKNKKKKKKKKKKKINENKQSEQDKSEYKSAEAPKSSSANEIHDYFKGCNSWEQIHERYKKLMHLYHPDNNSGVEEYAKEINDQYEKLKEKYKI
jgi:hypothetical protein